MSRPIPADPVTRRGVAYHRACLRMMGWRDSSLLALPPCPTAFLVIACRFLGLSAFARAFPPLRPTMAAGSPGDPRIGGARPRRDVHYQLADLGEVPSALGGSRRGHMGRELSVEFARDRYGGGEPWLRPLKRSVRLIGNAFIRRWGSESLAGAWVDALAVSALSKEYSGGSRLEFGGGGRPALEKRPNDARASVRAVARWTR
jgi:hypothetical protein